MPSIGITAYGGPGNNTIIGSQAPDILAGGGGDETIMGGRGRNQIFGTSGINVDVITRQLSIVTTNKSSFPNRDAMQAGHNLLYGDMPGATRNDPFQSQLAIALAQPAGLGTITRGDSGSWLAQGFVAGQPQVPSDGVMGGGVSSVTATTLTVTTLVPAAFAAVDVTKLHVVSVAWYGNFDSIVIGNHGEIDKDAAGPCDTTKPIPTLPQEIQTTLRVRKIQSKEVDNFSDKIIYGSGGDDILIGGGGNNAIQGGPGGDMCYGHHVVLYRTAHLNIFTNPLFQDLSGTQIYSTAAANEGQLLTDGIPQLDPRGHASWGDYLVTLPGNSFGAEAAYRGDNYIAGGGGTDMIFGELGNNTIQGDGSIDYVSQPYVPGAGSTYVYPSASGCTTGGHPGKASVLWRVGACRDSNNLLLVNSSVDRAWDASDYIEGGGGNNVIFGNGGPNDIIGGNSDLFSLGRTCNAAHEVGGAARTCKRPSGSNLSLGRSGTMLDREHAADTSPQGHAKNSSVTAAQSAARLPLFVPHH